MSNTNFYTTYTYQTNFLTLLDFFGLDFHIENNILNIDKSEKDEDGFLKSNDEYKLLKININEKYEDLIDIINELSHFNDGYPAQAPSLQSIQEIAEALKNDYEIEIFTKNDDIYGLSSIFDFEIIKD